MELVLLDFYQDMIKGCYLGVAVLHIASKK